MTENACPICGDGQLIAREGFFDTKFRDRRGAEHALKVPNVRRLECTSCSEQILDDTASRQVEAARRDAMGLLSCDEIRELRSQFGRTQVQMSHLLGVGEKTYCRWESGAFVQSVAFDNYLRLLREVPEACATLIRLEHGGGAGDQPARQEMGAEFEFLKNIEAVEETGVRFTRLMVTGSLYVAVSHPARVES